MEAGRLRTLAPGIRWQAVPSPTLPPATTTNCWLLGATELVAVDPAGVTEADQATLSGNLRAAGLRVARILLTHHHGDHIGGAPALRAAFAAPVLAHPATADRLPFAVDGLLHEGDPLPTDDGRDWRLLHTPGHASGHLCAFDGETVLAGDMVAGEGTIVLDPPEGDLGLYLASLRRLRDLAPTRLLPAHGPAIAPALPLLDHYIAHRQARTDQLRRALADGAPRQPIDLVPTLYPELPADFYPVAARQVLCHLRWLVTAGEAQADPAGWRLGRGHA